MCHITLHVNGKLQCKLRMSYRWFSDSFECWDWHDGGLNGWLGGMTIAELWLKMALPDHSAPWDQAGKGKKEKQINVASPPPLLVQTLHHLSCCLLLTSAWTGPAAGTLYSCQVCGREQVKAFREVIWRAQWQAIFYFIFFIFLTLRVEPRKQHQPPPSVLDLIIYSCCFCYSQMLTN